MLGAKPDALGSAACLPAGPSGCTMLRGFLGALQAPHRGHGRSVGTGEAWRWLLGRKE